MARLISSTPPYNGHHLFVEGEYPNLPGWFWPALFAICLGAITVIAGCGGNAKDEGTPEAKPQPVAVHLVTVRHGPVRERLRYIGTVRPRHEVTVPARVAGTVLSLPFAEGEAVSRGSVVAKIDTPETAARSRQLGAEIERTLAERTYLCERLKVEETLFEGGILSLAQLDLSRKNCASATAGVRATEAAMAEFQSVAARNEERASLDGTVLQVKVEAGEHVVPGRPLLVLGSQELEIAVEVTERDVVAGVGRDSKVLVGLGDGEVEASVRSIGATARGQGRTLEVRVALPDEKTNATLRPGMSAHISFIAAEEPETSTAVPVLALVQTDNGYGVFTVDDEGRLTLTEVVPTVRELGWVAIKPGLPPGTSVVMGNTHILKEGMPIYPVHLDEGGRL